MLPIEAVWNDLRAEGNVGGSRLVDPEHPLALYGTIDDEERPALLLVTDVEPPAQPELDAVRVTSAVRADGNVAVVIRLVVPSLEIRLHICARTSSTRAEKRPSTKPGLLSWHGLHVGGGCSAENQRCRSANFAA